MLLKWGQRHTVISDVEEDSTVDHTVSADKEEVLLVVGMKKPQKEEKKEVLCFLDAEALVS